MKRILLIITSIFIILGSIPAAYGSNISYVSGIMQITLRTGPGIDHKIVAMINSGQSMTILEAGEDWSQARLPNGKIGWVLNRLITKEKPKLLRFDALEKRYKQISDRLATLQTENVELLAEKERLTDELMKKTQDFNKVSTAYSSLKKRSEKLLSLESKFKENDELLEKQTVKTESLEEELARKNIKWFLCGAGVLLAGFMIGISSRRKQKSSRLL